MKPYLTYMTLVSAALLASLSASGQDRQTLDLLVAKGVITKAEAELVAKKSVSISPKEKTTKSLKLIGRVQTQYEYIGVEEFAGGSSTSLTTKNDFIMRRMFLGMSADLGAGWSATVIADFGRSDSNYLEYTYISKKFDWEFLNGTADIGYKKNTFALEEYTSASKLLTVERSLATRYFSEGNNGRRLGLEGWHTGLFWQGKVDCIDGLSYGVSLTNSFNNSPASIPTGSDNSFLYGANVSYKTSIGDAKIEAGANLAYTDGMNVAGTAASRHSAVMGANPYVKIGYDGFSLWADFLIVQVRDGKSSWSENAMPMGVNVAAEYVFDIGELGKIGPAARWSWLDSDGRGIKMSDGVRNSNATTTYNAGQSVYVGINWYINGNDLKFQLGYEWAQMQVLF